jgi:hypothetical protein
MKLERAMALALFLASGCAQGAAASTDAGSGPLGAADTGVTFASSSGVVSSIDVNGGSPAATTTTSSPSGTTTSISANGSPSTSTPISQASAGSSTMDETGHTDGTSHSETTTRTAESSRSEVATHTEGSQASSSGGGGDCYKPPVALHAETQAGVYCPFSGSDGADAKTCEAGQHCCEPSSGTSTCESPSTECQGSDTTDWWCEGAPDCASMPGTVCCGTGHLETQAAQPSCGDGGYAAFPYVSDFTGSSCKASCSTYQICSRSSECPSGQSCVAVEPKGNGIGYCTN